MEEAVGLGEEGPIWGSGLWDHFPKLKLERIKVEAMEDGAAKVLGQQARWGLDGGLDGSCGYS